MIFSTINSVAGLPSPWPTDVGLTTAPGHADNPRARCRSDAASSNGGPMHNDGRLAFWATMGLGGGPVLFYRGFKAMRTRRLIADTPTARIRSMAMGLVEVNGVAEPRSLVNAPFSGKNCAYWEIDISQAVRNRWDVVYRD